LLFFRTIIQEKHDEIDVECAGVMTSHTQDVKRVVWHPFEDILASASYDDTIKIYEQDVGDGDDWSTSATLSGHASTVWGLDFDPTGKRLASSSDDKTIKIWAQTQLVIKQV
jgi:WD40 repeat protein